MMLVMKMYKWGSNQVVVMLMSMGNGEVDDEYVQCRYRVIVGDVRVVLG